MNHLEGKHFIVIGGGIVGLATAYKILLRGNCQVTLVEKEMGVGLHQSGRNSGVLHAGLYYRPGSLKARLAVNGLKQMVRFCEQFAIPFEQCGKLVVATNDQEEERLKFLFENGKKNGLKGLRLLSKTEAVEIEPHIHGQSAIHVPEEGIVDYSIVCQTLAREIKRLEGTLRFGFKLSKVRQSDHGWMLYDQDDQVLTGDYVINCSGLYSDTVSKLFGCHTDIQIVPFRGDYYLLNEEGQQLVKHLIYPVPDPAYPFLGVHFTRMISGGVEAGPNAVLAFKKEGYRFSDFDFKEFWEAVSFIGLRKFLFQHKLMVWEELKSSLLKHVFVMRLRKLVPEVRPSHLSKGTAGVRAQAMHKDGTLVQDFAIEKATNALHLINAPSPGATASLAIADYILAQI